MNKLSRTQLAQLARQLRQTNPHQALEPELLDHLASLIEHEMDRGQPFDVAAQQVIQQASPQAMVELTQHYIQEVSAWRSPAVSAALKARGRLKRRPATKPFRYMLISNVFTFVLLMGFLIVVSRPLAVPLSAFRLVWGTGALLAILFLWWWSTGKVRTTKRSLTTR
ncbi:hypothetical protein FAES_0383 [Fibrella aestuarina BUZ 2]|uniref:Uncharacterized protein n=1 Tax=Fibrella aestuarina BUZ 2 TaxID=1166018 RepID=I0K2P2_9BACT|nr:hypothetical protein [Fibrella aestuarina]CCG98395.1 hypothetical protein FAES_0383 [Fibrella aestuarina BUZ 2]